MKYIVTLLFIIIQFSASAQKSLRGWHLLDPTENEIHGISLQKAYNLLQSKKPTQVVVAVIDGGIDTTHEDLKQILWRNPKEIPGNGKDDDGNGYIDDVYGWNFLGGKDGRNVEKEHDEKTRIYHQYKNQFLGKEIDEKKLSKDELKIYQLWKTASSELDPNPDDAAEIMMLDGALNAIKKQNEILVAQLKKEEFSGEELETFECTTTACKDAKTKFITFLNLLGMDNETTNLQVIKEIEDYLSGKRAAQTAKTDPFIDYRKDIVKDDYNNFNDRYYGNADVMGGDPKHGTHVSGIIAAQRNNGVGIDGVADAVKIMTLRAVPDGDEYDKDVALSIMYAVNNGAKVINMSFGKSYSPQKHWVDAAIKYAAEKDVLLIHAAGNDAKNIDVDHNYPSAYLFDSTLVAPNMITVGASADEKVESNLIASFSNYGEKAVNVFAPGVKIYSTIPKTSKYANQQGTSMAAPVVAGLAAILRAYFPSLTAIQVKEIIESTAVGNVRHQRVIKPGSNEEVNLSDLCSSGGIINAFAAVQKALEITQNK